MDGWVHGCRPVKSPLSSKKHPLIGHPGLSLWSDSSSGLRPFNLSTMNATASSQIFNPAAIRPLRILYADDVRQLREFMTVMLTREGHLVETVVDGAAALDWIERAPAAFDLLITDHHMPRLNGLELVRAVRHLPYAGKIIVFSSELSEMVHERYRRLNVDLILPKPIFPVTFRQMLKELYAQPAA